MLLKRLLTHSFVAVFAESVISAAVVTRVLAKAAKQGGPPCFLEQIIFDVVIRMH